MQQYAVTSVKEVMITLGERQLIVGKNEDGATDGRRKDYEPKTPFQEWLKPLLVARKWGSSELARELVVSGQEVGENYIYRIVRGDPAKFPNAERPGYELAFAIGRIMGDVKGAIRAAGYPLPEDGRIHDPKAVYKEEGVEVTLIDPTYMTDEEAQEFARLIKDIAGFVRRKNTQGI